MRKTLTLNDPVFGKQISLSCVQTVGPLKAGSISPRRRRVNAESDSSCQFRFQCETDGVRKFKALGEMSPVPLSVSNETGSTFFRFQSGLIDRLIDRVR